MGRFKDNGLTPGLVLVGAALILASPVRADVTLLGAASIAGDARDKSGLTDTLSEGTPHNRLGSIGSGVAYTGVKNRYVLNAAGGSLPKPAMEQVPYAEPFPLTAAELTEAVKRLETWSLAPAWSS